MIDSQIGAPEVGPNPELEAFVYRQQRFNEPNLGLRFQGNYGKRW